MYGGLFVSYKKKHVYMMIVFLKQTMCLKKMQTAHKIALECINRAFNILDIRHIYYETDDVLQHDLEYASRLRDYFNTVKHIVETDDTFVEVVRKPTDEQKIQITLQLLNNIKETPRVLSDRKLALSCYAVIKFMERAYVHVTEDDYGDLTDEDASHTLEDVFKQGRLNDETADQIEAYEKKLLVKKRTQPVDMETLDARMCELRIADERSKKHRF